MKISIADASAKTTHVSEMILGHNIETALTTVNGLLSDRLRNPKFTGPPHRMTGIAPEWYGASSARISYELTPGAGLMGSDAQLIRTTLHDVSPALHQNRIQIRHGEKLELEIWARAWHEPVSLRIDLCPLAKTIEPYASATVRIDASFYKRYTAILDVPRDDDEARLALVLPAGGAIWIDQLHLRPANEPLLCAGVNEVMDSMRIPTLRFPGGIVTAAYNWKHGTGPVHLRPALLEAPFHQDWYLNYDFGLDEYLSVCHEQEIRPALTLNLATGTPEEAAEMAAYCAEWYEAKKVTPPEIYWHIGNHPYVFTLAQMTPAMYVDVLRIFIPAVKNNYPNSRIVAAMSRSAVSTAQADEWRDAILDNAAELVDVLQVQPYGVFGPRPENPGDYTGGIADPVSLIEIMRKVVRNFESDCRIFFEHVRSRSIDIRLGAAEWNCWTQASHWDGRDFEEPPTTLHGLFVANMFHAFVRLAPEFEVAHFYNLVNCMGILNHRGAEVEATFMVELFNLYRDALPGKRLEVETTVNGSNDQIDVICLQREDATYVFAVNFGPDAPVTIELETDPPAGSHHTTMGFRGELLADVMSLWSDRVDVKQVVLPPLSVTRIELQA